MMINTDNTSETTLENVKPIERRKHERVTWNKKASIRLGLTKLSDCIIKDISSSGAKIVLPNGTWVPSEFALDIGSEASVFNAKTVWVNGSSLGVEFTQIAC